MAAKTQVINFPAEKAAKVIKWKIKEGAFLSIGRVILLYDENAGCGPQFIEKLKSTHTGMVRKLLLKEGDLIEPGHAILELEECSHPTVMNAMCAECGADLRKDDRVIAKASVPMVHSIPELKVSKEQAKIIGRADEQRLLKEKKLVLLVDLDQTLIHTTNDNIPPNLKDVYHFQLYGPSSPWYHTRLRPGTHKFLKEMSQYYELHICTFGARNYAHTIALFLDQDGKYFSHRILSRDECFNSNSKTANLDALFPCGDNMVCIIDDREDVWNFAPNLIHVKPYHFFQHTGDINAPPGLAKCENDEKEGFDFTKLDGKDQSSGVKRENGKFRTDEKTENLEEKIPDEVLSESELPTGRNVSSKSSTVSDENDTCDNQENIQLKSSGILKENEFSEPEVNIEAKIDDKKEASENKNVLVQEDNSANEYDIENVNLNSDLCEKVDDNKDNVSPKSSDSSKTITNSCDAKDNCSDKNDNEDNKKNLCEKPAHSLRKNNDEDELVEVEDGDDYLLYLEEILKTIHKAFYQLYDQLNGQIPDLKNVIPQVRRKVLAGENLVFSGLVPTHIALEKSKAYQIACSLGATVTQDLTSETTHLVAVRPGTAKVNAARKMKNVFIVTPEWLWTCAERWEHVDERLFPLNRSGSTKRHPPPHCASPEPKNPVNPQPAVRQRTNSGRFMDTINPLMTFSSEDIAIMDREVEDICNESDESDGGDPDVPIEEEEYTTQEILSRKNELEEESSSSNSSDSLSGGDHPHGWGPKSNRKRKITEKEVEEEAEDDDIPSVKFRRGEELPSDLDLGDDSNSSTGSEEPIDDMDDGEWNMMGAALEREFLSGNGE